MFKIVTKRVLNEAVVLMEIEAPFIAKKAQPGQFIIFRVDEHGERVPLTIADCDREKGTVTIIFQIVGRSTEKLSALNEGDTILDFVGPLGVPTHIEEDAKSVLFNYDVFMKCRSGVKISPEVKPSEKKLILNQPCLGLSIDLDKSNITDPVKAQEKFEQAFDKTVQRVKEIESKKSN